MPKDIWERRFNCLLGTFAQPGFFTNFGKTHPDDIDAELERLKWLIIDEVQEPEKVAQRRSKVKPSTESPLDRIERALDDIPEEQLSFPFL